MNHLQYLSCVGDKKFNVEDICESDLDPCALEKLQDASVTVLKELAASIDDYNELPKELLDCIDAHRECEEGGSKFCLAKFNRCALRMLEESASRDPIQ